MGSLRPWDFWSADPDQGTVIDSAPLTALTSLSALNYQWLDGALPAEMVFWGRNHCWTAQPCCLNLATSEAVCVAVIAVSCADNFICLHRRSGATGAVRDRPEICKHWCDALSISRCTPYSAVTTSRAQAACIRSAVIILQFARAIFALELG